MTDMSGGRTCVYCGEWKTFKNFRKEERSRGTYYRTECSECQDKRNWDRQRRRAEIAQNDPYECFRCREWKPSKDFHLNKKEARGLNQWCKKCRSDSEHWKKEKQEYNRSYHLKYRFNLTLEQYLEKEEEQGGLCALCFRPNPDGNQLSVDHDHRCCPGNKRTCGECTRQLLCRTCNYGLGQLKDDPDLLRRAADYIERHRRDYPDAPTG